MSNCARLAATKRVAALKAEAPCAPSEVKDIGYAEDVFTRETMKQYLSKDTWMNLARALAAMREAAPGRGYFIHMSHDVRHAAFSRKLPRGVRLSYDGLKVRV